MSLSSTKLLGALGALALAALPQAAHAVIQYDQNVTSNAIWGSGNANGSFTTDRANGVELGLRGKLRHNALGQAENTFNSNGDGTYTFAAGTAVSPNLGNPPLPGTAVWSFEWSINTDYNNSTGWQLNDLTYVLGIDYNAGAGTTFSTFDPIHALNPQTVGGYWDHSMGTNGTAAGAGVEANNAGTYATNIGLYNLAQNSWKAHWYMPAGQFDPNASGTYDIYLAAFDQAGNQLARTSIQINAVPDGGSIGVLLGAALLALGAGRRRFVR